MVTDEVQMWTTTNSRNIQVALVPDQQSTTTNIPTERTSPFIHGKIQMFGTSVKRCILISHQRHILYRECWISNVVVPDIPAASKTWRTLLSMQRDMQTHPVLMAECKNPQAVAVGTRIWDE
jgi:hypothetical protein